VLSILSLLSLVAQDLYGQCGSGVPEFVVDLSGDPSSVWLSPDTVRNDTCCGSSHPDRCVAFVLTLDSSSTGIIFDICEGAVPPGALFYQVSCGTPTQVGEILCLSGPGPHYITFCKPGANQNIYCIRSIPLPNFGPDVTVNDGCTDTLWTIGLEDTSIVWTSIFPGSIGAYDSTLSCTEDCEITIVTGGPSYPPYVDYKVCGFPAGACDTIYVCDTIRVNFFTTLEVNILPLNPTVCFGSSGTTLTANPSGGSLGYFFRWNTGDTGASINNVGVGTYIVELTDTSGCFPVYDTVNVTSFSLPIKADAGLDQTLCISDFPFPLSGSVDAATGGIWWGGAGTFSALDTSLSNSYTPSPMEIINGFATLFLTTTGNGSCPADTDTVELRIVNFAGIPTPTVSNVACNGTNGGSIAISVSGGYPPFAYQWDAAAGFATTQTVSGLGIGTYAVTVTNSFGCDTVFSLTITEPPALVFISGPLTNVACNGDNSGSASFSVTGGTLPYSYLWSDGQTTATASNLPAGSYTLTVTDDSSCVIDTSITITEPPAILLIIGAGDTLCVGDTASLSATANGGKGSLTYNWSHGLPDLTTHKVSPYDNTLYYVSIFDSLGCSGPTGLIYIHVLNLALDNLVAGSNGDICIGESTQVYATHDGTDDPYTYNWDDLGAGLGPFTVTPDSTTTYTVTVVDRCGNSIIDSVTVQVFPYPVIILPDTIKMGCVPLGVSFMDTANTGDLIYFWDFGDGSTSTDPMPYHTYYIAGNYQVNLSITSINGCESVSIGTHMVYVYPNPIANFVANPWRTDMRNPEISFINSSTGAIGYFWDFGDNNNSTDPNPTHTYNDSATYQVVLKVENEFGCRDSIQKRIRIDPYFTIEIPNAFTPDPSHHSGGVYSIDDLDNDVFHPHTEGVTDYHLMIFNRWGEMIFESFDLNIGWDGNYRDESAQQGVYVWKLEINWMNGQHYSSAGDITLFR